MTAEMARTLDPLDDDRLDRLRQTGDPEADELAADLRARHPDLDERDVVRLVLDQIVAGPRATEEAVRDWLLGGPPLPEWADPALIKAGQEFFGDWPMPIASSLFCVSLPSAYAAADGVQVLAMTSDLATSNLVRRIAETGQMLFDVMDLGRASPTVLQPGGQGYLTARGVRLLHGVVRKTLTCEQFVAQTCDDVVKPRWCPEWGVPVNQEDLMGTLLTFSVAVFHGLDRLGLPYDPRAADAYLHTWCVIGFLLGIDDGLLPLEREQAEQLALEIARRHHRSSEAGHRLMAVLLQQMETSMPLGMRKVPRTLARHMLPDDIVAQLGLPPAAWWRPLLGLLAHTGPVLGRLAVGRWMVREPTEVLGRSMLRMLVDHSLQGERPAFRLDAQVAEQLSIPTSPTRRSLRARRRRVRIEHGRAGVELAR
jgi:hypothetical protein